MKMLLMIMAAVEFVAGVPLLLVPGIVVPVLVGIPLDTPAGLVVGHIAGAALVALAIACWQARDSERGGAGSGVIAAMLFYNEAAACLLVYAGMQLGLNSELLWPVIILHQVLAVWCLVNLWVTAKQRLKAAESRQEKEELI
jgi:hypothetical protein